MPRKIAALFTIVLIIAAVHYGGGYLIGKAACDYFNKNVREHLGIPASIQKVKINLLRGIVEVHGLSIKSGSASTGRDAGADLIRINIEWMPLFTRKLIIEEMEIKKPVISIAQGKPSTASKIVLAVAGIPMADIMRPAWKKKYPPATIEKLTISDASVYYTYENAELSLTNLHLYISRFWRSPDRSRVSLSFSASSGINDRQGIINVMGDYSFEDRKHTFSGELTIEKLELKAIEPFLSKSIPVHIKTGYLTVHARPQCNADQLNTIFRLNISGLSIQPMKGHPKIAGFPVPMIQAFLSSTGGNLHTDLQMTGTIHDPYVNLNELLSQIIAQKLHGDVRKKFNKKAVKAARKISGILKKSTIKTDGE